MEEVFQASPGKDLMHLNCMARTGMRSGREAVLIKSSGGWGLRFLPWLAFPTKPTPAERLETRRGRRVRNQCNCNCAVLLAKAEHFTAREIGENGFFIAQERGLGAKPPDSLGPHPFPSINGRKPARNQQPLPELLQLTVSPMHSLLLGYTRLPLHTNVFLKEL